MRFVPTALLLIFLVISVPFCYSAQYALTYDSNGNLIAGDGYYRVYNSLNQLWKIYNGTNSSGMLLEDYVYSSVSESIDIKRVYNSTGAVKETTYYWTDEFKTLVNSSGEFNITDVYHEGQLLSETTNGMTVFMHTDNKGTVVAVTNATGSMIDNTSYDPFGDITSGGSASKLGYEAKESDTIVKDVDFHFRKYKPDWGIFTQPDTLIQNVYDPQSLNHYSFERNNPYKYTDSNGHEIPLVVVGIIIVAGFFVFGAIQEYLTQRMVTGKMYSFERVLAAGGNKATVGIAQMALVVAATYLQLPSVSAMASRIGMNNLYTPSNSIAAANQYLATQNDKSYNTPQPALLYSGQNGSPTVNTHSPSYGTYTTTTNSPSTYQSSSNANLLNIQDQQSQFANIPTNNYVNSNTSPQPNSNYCSTHSSRYC